MAYDREKIFQDSKKLIEDNELYFIEDIVSLLPIHKSTFYEFFPIDSDEYDELKGMLDKNRVTVKSSMRKKWKEADAPALQIALMKLICTDDEAHRLNGSKTVNENVNKNVAILNNDPFEDEIDQSASEDIEP